MSVYESNVRVKKYPRGIAYKSLMVTSLISILISLGCSGEVNSNSSLLEICEEIGVILEADDGKKQTDSELKSCLSRGKQLAILGLNDLKTFNEQMKQLNEQANQMAREEQEALEELRAKNKN